MSSSDVLRVVLIVFLLIVSGLFSAAEISFLALGRHRAQRVAGGVVGSLIDRLLSRPAMTLGTVLVMITAVNYLAEAIATGYVITHALPVWTAIVVVALLVMVFSEAVPISYAAANPERVARTSAIPVWAAYGLLSVPARAIGFVADRLVHLLGARPRPEQPVTEGEIRAIVDIQAETGGLEEEEKAMIHHIFEFGEKTAQEVMVPRTSMVAIARTGTVREAGELTTERRVSRLPVYGEDLDDIVGVVYAKDLLPLLAAGQDEAAIGSVMRPVLRVPETKRLSDLMTDFRRHRRTFAIVLDEYGGTAGLVTLEDLLEEVVGDIYDEYDIVRAPIEQLASGAVALDGRMGIDEASAALGVELPEGDYSSVAGLLYDRLGMVPRTGQVLDLDGIRLVVDELDGHRISRVLALRIPERSAGAEGDGPSQATT
ncbi:MAG: hemolysin family protein [Armatimonadota bacterium]|jgi:CBS domain containing-hemolysin-like protein